MTRPVFIFILALPLLTTSTLSAQPTSSLRATLPQFEVQNVTIPDAIVKAGQQAGVPIGLDASDPRLWKNRVSVQRSNTTLGEVLGQILNIEPGYTVSQDGKTIVVRPALRPSDLLNTRIVLFQSPALAAGDESLKLWMALVMQLDPSRQGFMGFDRTSKLDKVLPPIDLSGKTVWEILDWIVGTHGSAAWVAVPFSGEIGKSVGQRDIWHLVFYPNVAAHPQP